MAGPPATAEAAMSPARLAVDRAMSAGIIARAPIARLQCNSGSEVRVAAYLALTPIAPVRRAVVEVGGADQPSPMKYARITVAAAEPTKAAKAKSRGAGSRRSGWRGHVCELAWGLWPVSHSSPLQCVRDPIRPSVANISSPRPARFAGAASGPCRFDGPIKGGTPALRGAAERTGDRSSPLTAKTRGMDADAGTRRMGQRP